MEGARGHSDRDTQMGHEVTWGHRGDMGSLRDTHETWGHLGTCRQDMVALSNKDTRRAHGATWGQGHAEGTGGHLGTGTPGGHRRSPGDRDTQDVGSSGDRDTWRAQGVT